MAFLLEFERETELICVKVSGEIDPRSLARALQELESDGLSQPGRGIIFDARENQYVPSSQEVYLLCTSDEWWALLHRYDIAIVVSSSIQFGIANIIARRSESIGGRVERFYNVDDARCWLETVAGEAPMMRRARS